MISLVFAVILAIIMAVAIVINKTYHQTPLKEMKLQARRNQQPAKSLYRAAAYGVSLQTLLLLIIILCAGGSFALLANHLAAWFAYIVIVFLLWLGFLWLPSARSGSLSRHLSLWLARPLAWVLNYTHPTLERIGFFMHDNSAPYGHTGLYDKTDLVELLRWQKSQPDNRITHSELDIAESVLTFGDKKVYDALVPKKAVYTIRADDLISPVIIDELHKTGHKYFPVYDLKKDNIVGTIFIGDLVNEVKHSNPIKSVMNPSVCYVHEDASLSKVFKAFLSTHQHLFIVINKFEEFIGVIGVDELLSEMLGVPLEDDDDNYHDLRSVAISEAKEEHEIHEAEGQEVVE